MSKTTHKSRRAMLGLITFAALAVTVSDASAANTREVDRRPQFAGGCTPANGFANEFMAFAVSVITATDSETVALRDAWKIPPVLQPDVVFETDSATCVRAAKAHAAVVGSDTVNPAAVVLIRAGSTRYIAFNGGRVGESFLYYVFDSAFHYLKTIGS